MLNRAFSKIWILAMVIILVGGGILFWQYFLIVEEVEAPETEAPETLKEKEETSRLTIESLENAEYYFALYNKETHLINGLHEEEELVDEGGYPYIFSAGMVKDKVAFGDLDNDEKEDAVVIIYSSGGRSGLFYEFAVMINENGNPYHLTSKYLGDRIEINSLAIQDGVITVDMLIHDVGDAACCPTLHKVSQYKLFENNLLEL